MVYGASAGATMRAPLLLLKLKQGKRKYFGFSKKRPGEVTALVNSWKK